MAKIFVIGFVGSDRVGLAKKIATEKNLTFHDMDQDIEAYDGRSVLRMVISMGEHEYRNKEYEQLQRYQSMDDIVVACGDGIVLDDDSRKLLVEEEVLVAEDSIENLWKNALRLKNTMYAFLYDGNTPQAYDHFTSLYQQRQPLFDLFRKKEKNHD